MTIQTIPPTVYQVAFNADPNQSVVPPYWSDISSRAQFAWSSDRGRHYEFDIVETGMWRTALANADGALDPSNTASPFAPGVVPYRQARIRCLPGPNLLTPDQATGGEGSGFGTGTPGMGAGVTCDYNPYVVAASGTAYQGTQVWQTTGTTSPSGKNILTASVRIPQVAGAWFAFSAQVRSVTTSANPGVFPFILWYNAAGVYLGGAFGSVSTLTGGPAAGWTAVSVAGQTPAGAVVALLGAQLSTAPGGTWSFQVDGMQFEQNPFATSFQVPNAVSVNRFPRSLATGGLSTGSATGVWKPDAGSIAYVTGLTAAPPGQTSAIGWTTPAGTTTGPNLWSGPETGGVNGAPSADNVQVTAGLTYTASVYMLRAASADATLAVTPAIIWYPASGGPIGSGSVGSPVTLSTTVWGRPTVTGTAPAGAVWGRFMFYMSTPATSTATNTFYVTAGQFELAGSASTWQDPGTAYSVITPYIERWPQGWDQLNGTYGTDDIQAVDAQAGLAQFTLPAPFVAEVLALNPNFFYQLNDPLGSSSCTDTAGKRVPAPIENSPFGAGSLVLGNPVTATTVPTGGFSGTPGPVATFNNNSGGYASPVQQAETFISLHKTAAIPGVPPNGNWTRIFHFRSSAAPGAGNAYTLWSSFPQTALLSSNLSFFQFLIGAAGQAWLYVSGSSGLPCSYTVAGPNVCDGNWHQLALAVDGSGNVTMYVDGSAVAPNGGTTSVTLPVTGCSSDVLGASIQIGANYYRAGVVGDVACAVEFPAVLTAAQITTLYNSWRTASTGDTSGGRASRVLKWVGWTGPTAIDTGMTTSMGPATDLTGATALDALNNIALTENGQFFVSASGVVTFKARNARYGATTPVYTFGEQTSAGEWPYEYLHLEFDPTHIVNSAQVTQYGGPTVVANDPTSKIKNWPRAYQRTINTTSLPECSDAANYLLGQNKTPHQRVDVLRLHPSAVPGLFQVCLSLELGMRIRVNRRPQNAPPIVFDGFVEKISWAWDPDSGEVYVTLQCSPADLTKYWLLAALHTTLHAQANSGTNTISINALPDAAINVLKSSLPSAYQLTLDPGTAIAETVTIAPGGIPNTGLSYTSATLTLTANLVNTHASGAVVCEPLPAGYTDPTTWDASSVLGAAYAPILSGGAAGTNTVTVGPLQDGAVNALASTWNTGDVVWLSSGPGLGARTEIATILSVATTYPGYASCVITFTANLGFNHLVGEYVSDPLANNSINPSTLAATTRLAY